VVKIDICQKDDDPNTSMHENKNAFGESPFQKCIKESRNYGEEAPTAKIIISNTYK
jgi:hypothetical protein